VIDYKTTDFTTGEARYDRVFDCVGNKSPAACKRVLQGRRIYETTVPGVGTFLRQFINPISGMKVFALLTTGNGEDLTFLKSLVDKGQLKVVVDKVYPLAKVAEAQEYSKAGHAKGKLVLEM
jgi:NADPH:quinone reductase-like Zn-dependent oxidoreductase